MKRIAQEIFRHTLAAIDIHDALERRIDRRGPLISGAGSDVDLRDFREIVAIAFGKASFSMAHALSAILAPDFAVQGIVVGPDAQRRPLPGWEAFSGSHPLPTESSFAAGRAILDRLARCDEKSLVLFLISGGGSAMVESPLDPSLQLEDFRQLHSALVACGAPIEQINAIRKHLSAVKGGRLAAVPCSLKFTYAISDVPQGQESALASGPTLPDPTTVADAYAIAAKYDLASEIHCCRKENIRKPRTPRNSKARRRRFLGTISSVSSANMNFCTRRIMPRKPKVSIAWSIRSPMAGLSNEPRIICSKRWRISVPIILANASRFSREGN